MSHTAAVLMPAGIASGFWTADALVLGGRREGKKDKESLIVMVKTRLSPLSFFRIVVP